MSRPSQRFSAYTLHFTVVVLISIATTALRGQAANENNATQVDKVFADLQKPRSPGCALAVYRGGQEIYAKGYGLANIELDAPITPQTVFDIGSTSKQFTAASILLLEQQGRLSLNDDVRKYIPELPDYARTNGGQKITLLNLLNHTSGLRDYLLLLQLEGVNGDSVTTDDDALSILARQKNLNFSPGSEWSYSNTGFFLLSVIVKRVSGMTLREFASRNIFQPLHMTQTLFRDDHTLLLPHRALAYDPEEKNGYKLDVSYFEQLGDGAVHTSVEDLGKWDENFYSGQIGGKRLADELQEQGRLNSGKILRYAKGLFIVDYRGLHAVRHGGAWGGYRAELLRFPEQHFSVVCLCNVANGRPGRRAEKVADIYLANLMKPKPSAAAVSTGFSKSITLTAAQLDHLKGMYRDPKKQTIARVSVLKNKPQVEIYGGTFDLTALSPTHFQIANFPIDAEATFIVGPKQTMTISGDEEIAATYEKVQEFTPSAEALAAYTGAFQSDELAAVYHLRSANGKLTLAAVTDNSGMPRTGMPPSTDLRPTVTDEFEISSLGVSANFLRDANHQVTGFDLGTGGAHGIRFVRIQPPKRF